MYSAFLKSLKNLQRDPQRQGPTSINQLHSKEFVMMWGRVLMRRRSLQRSRFNLQ